MHRISFAILAATLILLGASACRSDAPARESATSRTTHGKPAAPVTVDAALGRSTARVSVRFEADVRDAHVRVHGVDGLLATSEATVVDGGAFARGDVRAFDVGFTPGPGRSHLVVAVSGTFDGAPQSRVASFGVGNRATARRRAGSTTTDARTDERVHLIPVDER